MGDGDIVKLVDEVENALVMTSSLHADVCTHVKHLTVLSAPTLHLKRAYLDVFILKTFQHFRHSLFRRDYKSQLYCRLAQLGNKSV